jgi:hypothetical protein
MVMAAGTYNRPAILPARVAAGAGAGLQRANGDGERERDHWGESDVLRDDHPPSMIPHP